MDLCYKKYAHQVCLTETKVKVSGLLLSLKYVTKKTEKSQDLWQPSEDMSLNLLKELR